MPKWIRVRDTATNHTFDIDARVLKHRRGVEPVNDPDRWPDIEGPRVHPRPPKPFVGKDGKARAATTDATSDGGTLDTSQVTGGEGQPQTEADSGRTRRSKTTSDPAGPSADTSKEQ